MSSDNKPLGFNYKGFPVTPSDRFYYNEYTYKVNFTGNSVCRDIKQHAKLDELLYTSYWFQSTYTNKNRVVYIRDLSMLDDVLDQFPNLVEKVFGPVDKAHLDHLENPWKDDLEFNFVYKDKLWYNKYDIKIDLRSRERYTWRSIRSNNTPEGLEKTANEFMGFMKLQDFPHHMYLNTEAKYWHQNYLYCTSEDLKEIKPWISMLYSEVIEKINSVVIYTTDK